MKNYTDEVSPERIAQVDRYMRGELTKQEFLDEEGVTAQRFYQILDNQGIPLRKVCTCCNKNRALTSFHRNKIKKFYREAQCKNCYNKKKRKHRKPSISKLSDKSCRDCKEMFPNTGEYFYTRVNKDKSIATTPRCIKCHKAYAVANTKKNLSRHKKAVNKWMRKDKETLGDLYICTLIRLRKGSKKTMYKHERADYPELIEKARTKLKLEREIISYVTA